MKRRIAVGLSALIFLLLPGCSSSTPGAATPSRSTASGSTFPMTITDDDRASVSIPAQPTRIVTFAPSMTEIVFALGLGNEIVGVSGPYDDYPPEATSIKQVGGAGDFGVDPNVEEVVSLQPDLFLTISGGDQWKQRLRDLGVPVVTLNATNFEDLLHDIVTVGQLTGADEQARALTQDMQSRADAVASQVVAEGRVSCFFEVYYPPLQTVGPDTFIYDLLERAGCDPVTSSAKSDYPQWSVDKLVAESPQVYLATPESAKSVSAVAKRPGFDGITAVVDGNVALVNSDLVTRPGPRMIDGLEELATALHPTD